MTTPPEPEKYRGMSPTAALLLGLDHPELVRSPHMTAGEGVLHVIMRCGPHAMEAVRPLVAQLKDDVGDTYRERQAREKVLQGLRTTLPELGELEAVRMRDAIFAIARAEKLL